MVNFSVGLGSFAQGMGQGMQMAQQVKGAIDNRKMRKMEKQASAAATTAREKDIAGAIQTTANADGSSTFAVGGKSFSSSAEARKAAEGQVGSVMDYYRSTTVPQLIQGYVEMGKPEQAAQLESWMETQESNKLTRDWAKSARLAMIGDNKGAMRGFGKLYERMEPGSKYMGTEDITEPVFEEMKLPKTGETVRIENGTRTTGLRLKLRNADGEDISHDFGGSEDLFNTAMFTLSPDKFAARALAQVDAAQTSRAKMAGELAKEKRELAGNLTRDKYKASLDDQNNQRQFERGVLKGDREFAQQTQRDSTQQGYDLEKITTSKQMDAALAPVMEAAKARGDTPEDARKAIGAIWKTLSDNDMPGEDGFKSKSVEDQIKSAAQIYQQQRSAARGVVQGANGAGSGTEPGKGIPKLW